MNSVCIIGTVVRDPELQSTATGVSYTRFTLAVDSGTKNDQAYFFNLITWRETAEFVAKYFQKGAKMGVSGYLTSGSYEKNGEKRSFVEIVATKVDFASSKKRETAEESEYHAQPTTKRKLTTVEEEDLPF